MKKWRRPYAAQMEIWFEIPILRSKPAAKLEFSKNELENPIST
jgi:hypothetical protein